MIDPTAPSGGPSERRSPDGSPDRPARERAGRYTLHAEIASGGMATVYYGQMSGAHGFSRVVAIKRMLPRLAREPSFRSMFVDEARLASRVQHPNVVPILDVVDDQGEVMIVMEYVRGPSLSALLQATLASGARVPVPIAASVVCSMLAGLHAAHEARDRQGRTLGIVHRDVSPQNVLVGFDGVTRIMDFGVAKASNRMNVTEDRQLKGKLSYMAPEQFQGTGVDRRTDVFAAAVVLWGMLAGRRLFRGSDVAETMSEVLRCDVPLLATLRDDVPAALEAALRAALNPDREARPATAERFALAIEAAVPPASTRAVAEWAQTLASERFAERDALIVEIEKTSTGAPLPLESGEPTDPSAGSTHRDLTDSRAVTTDWTPGSREPTAPKDTTTIVEGRRSQPATTSPAVALPSQPSGRTSARAGILAIGIVSVAALAWGVARSRETSSAADAASSSPVVTTETTPPAVASSVVTAAPSMALASSTEDAPNASVEPRPDARSQTLKKRPTTATPKSPKNEPTAPRGPYYPPAAFPK